MSKVEDSAWQFVHYSRPVYGDCNDPCVVYAWDGGRYVFLFWADDWEAKRYFASIENMPEHARKIVDEAISDFECWDVWDSEKKAPVFEPTECDFQLYIEKCIAQGKKES